MSGKKIIKKVISNLQPRDEASMARLGSEVYLIGGQGVKTTEVHC